MLDGSNLHEISHIKVGTVSKLSIFDEEISEEMNRVTACSSSRMNKGMSANYTNLRGYSIRQCV